MSRYIPTDDEQAAIELLTLAGYVVVRERTYTALQQRIERAELNAAWENRCREGSDAWARDCLAEERRLAKRLNAVCYAAAALGVDIDTINTALAAAEENA